MELLHFQGRRQRRTPALRFGAADAFRRSNHLDVSRSEQFQEALVEAEVVDRILDFSILDEPNSIARQTGEQGAPWIDAADIPEAAHQQTVLGRVNHLFDALRRRRTFDNRIYRSRGRLLAFFLCPVARVLKVFQYPM